MSDTKRRVVVTGMGALTPIGLSVNEFWNAMMESKSGAAMIKQFDTAKVDTKFACELKNFDVANYLDRKTARRLDPFAQYALIASQQAVEDANINPDNLSEDEKSKIGVIYGSGIGGIQTFYDQSVTNREQGPKRISPFFIPMLIPDIAAGHISIKYGFRGPNYCTVSACATGNNNMIDSYLLIKYGMADMMITGGSEASISELGVGGFNASRALSTRNDSPKTASRPFDVTRDGFVMGEGSGALVLEDLEHAIMRNARIYAEIIGAGLSADAHHITAPHPDGTGAILSMKMALEQANIKAEDIDYVNMHGTSTPLGDIAEPKAILKTFGEHSYKMSISSTKSMTGHLLGAAGAIEAIFCVLTLRDQVIAPTINLETPGEGCDLDYVPNVARKAPVNIAMSNSFGFGGTNATLVFKKV